MKAADILEPVRRLLLRNQVALLLVTAWLLSLVLTAMMAVHFHEHGLPSFGSEQASVVKVVFGQAFTHNALEWRVHRATAQSGLQRRYGKFRFPSAGACFVAVDYSIRSHRKKETKHEPRYGMRLLDSQGRTYKPSSKAMAGLWNTIWHPRTTAQTIQPGLEVHFLVLFEVPVGALAKPVRLVHVWFDDRLWEMGLPDLQAAENGCAASSGP